MKKRILSLFLILVMTLSLLPGCGKKESNTTDPDTQDSENLTEYEPITLVDDLYRNFYEIFVYSFYDSDGDGIGDLNGVTEKLDYIQDMGFNGIWLMPINQSPTYHKYDVTDYYAIDKDYGSMEDFKTLIEECHKRDIHIIIDFVFNHSSSQNKWFLDACEYLKTLEEGEEPDVTVCPYVEYYHFCREDDKKSGYYQVGDTEWYYEGVFQNGMPDLNLDSQVVRDEVAAIASYYLDMGVDGFRLDAVIHYTEGNATKNKEVLQWFMDYCRSVKEDVYVVGEAWDTFSTLTDYYSSTITSLFNFSIAQYDGKIAKLVGHTNDASTFGDAMVKIADSFGESYEDYIDAPFLGNHDTARIANSLTQDAAKIKYAAGLLLTMNGSPFVYYGDEIGMSSSGKKDENKRLPMIWSTTNPRGMAEGPKAADEGIESRFTSVEDQLLDPDSILNYYKHAIYLRNANPEIARGTVTTYPELSDENICVISKEYNGSTIYLIYNMGEESAAVSTESLTSTVTDAGTAANGNLTMIDCLTVDGSTATYENSTLTLPGYSICYMR